MDFYFAPASEAHQKKEKKKAQELKQSQWWRNNRGRGICYHCGEHFLPSEMTMDHLIPIARGGFSDKKNCVPSCKKCNTEKGYKTKAELAMDLLQSSTLNNKIDDDNHVHTPNDDNESDRNNR